MKSAWKLVILVFSFLALLSACGSSQTTPPPAAVSVTLIPNTANVTVTQSAQFAATVHKSTNTAVTWSLSGSGCSGITCGTISSTGLYTAPASVPSPATVTVKATSAADTSKSASATITIMAASGSLNDLWKYDPATNEWTWVSGSNIADQPGTYGTQGIADPSNVPGGRYCAVSWLDSSGKFWLFGGEVGDIWAEDWFNDLWKYDPATNEWTWVSGSNIINQAGVYGTQGIADPSNVPGVRNSAVSWIDSSGNLWLFGGENIRHHGDFNDLWKYDPVTNEWTWVSGSNTSGQFGIYGTKGTADPSNVPGARYEAVSWIDSSGKLWLFGGVGFDSTGNNGGTYNDLWKYDPATNEWTWVSGSNIINQAGVYGTQGTADPSNVPGARTGGVSWIDSSGNLWLFGGTGFNDLWKYDPATNEWTWVSGSNIRDQLGIWGTKGTADPSNIPGARAGAVSWIDSSGKLWLFGGSGAFNDLWKYDPATNEWTWVSGSNTINQAGVYGTQGTADPSNVPGARSVAVSWIDSSGNLWLFGGEGFYSIGNSGSLNDLWQIR